MVKHWTGQYGQMLEKRRGLSVENIPDVDDSLGDDANTMSNVRNKSSTFLKSVSTGKSTISTVQHNSVTSPLKSNSTGKRTISTVQDKSAKSPSKLNYTGKSTISTVQDKSVTSNSTVKSSISTVQDASVLSSSKSNHSSRVKSLDSENEVGANLECDISNSLALDHDSRLDEGQVKIECIADIHSTVNSR
uniref:Uncharacterized protein n=1 Tax=Cacopsylla melanoneura TaxID=428564 RepID=A0A8D8S7Y7_9HEMI